MPTNKKPSWVKHLKSLGWEFVHGHNMYYKYRDGIALAPQFSKTWDEDVEYVFRNPHMYDIDVKGE